MIATGPLPGIPPTPATATSRVPPEVSWCPEHRVPVPLRVSQIRVGPIA